MERNIISHGIIQTNETVLCPELFQTTQPQRLTPTGKISHAKTRVYTQRYRKEWEQMDDFKGWLTSVPYQATRAFCTYCKKNLHAHRLSLLKHTCTRKHQRAAMGHMSDQENKRNSDEKDITEYNHEFEHVNVPSISGSQDDEEEEAEGYEYVDEELDEEMNQEDVEEEYQHDDSVIEYSNLELEQESHEDYMHVNKKMRVEKSIPRDTLAEAMAHVHGEYIDQNNVEIELMVDSVGEDELHQVEDILIEEETIKSSPEVIENNIITYEIETSNESIEDQTENSTTSMTPVHNAIVLSPEKGLKTQIVTSYVVNQVKGNLSTALVARSKAPRQRTIVPKPPANSTPVSSPKELSTIAPGPSKEIRKEIQMTSYIKKNPCISTYVVDTNKGLPISGLQVSLYKLMDGRWTFLNESTTAANGRCADLVDLKKGQITAGRYKMHFDVDKYFSLRRIETMYPFIEIVFDVKNPTGNYHIPILLSPFSYTTFRGCDR